MILLHAAGKQKASARHSTSAIVNWFALGPTGQGPGLHKHRYNVVPELCRASENVTCNTSKKTKQNKTPSKRKNHTIWGVNV